MSNVTGREQVLRDTERAVMADRNADYAPPEENFRRIADLWNLYLEGRSEVTPYDTAIMMVLVKVARIQASPHLMDHLVDIAGYAACAGDVIPDAPDAGAEPDEDEEDFPLSVVVEGLEGRARWEVAAERWIVMLDNGGRRDFTSDQWIEGMNTEVIQVT